MARKFSELVRGMPPEMQERVQSRAKEVRKEYLQYRSLPEIRKALDITQVELARELHIRQAAVSKIERQTDMYISTLRKVIEALGGTLHIRATFPDGIEYEIDQLEQPTAS